MSLDTYHFLVISALFLIAHKLRKAPGLGLSTILSGGFLAAALVHAVAY